MTTHRTDIHSPLNMDPTAYEYVVAMDTVRQALAEGSIEGRAWAHDILVKLNRSESRAHHGAQCDHCGAWLRYAAIMHHLPSGDFIMVGETCLDNRFSLDSKAQFDALREAAALDRQAQAIKAQVTETLLALSETQPVEVIEFLGDRKGEADPQGLYSAAADIRRKFWTYGSISERQVAFVAKLLAEALAKAQKTAERPSEARLALSQIPEGDGLKVNGEVIKLAWQDNDFGGREVMTVKVTTPSGIYLVWGSVPSSLSVEKGDLVSFTANVVAKDEGFATFNRPRKASAVTPDPEEVLV